MTHHCNFVSQVKKEFRKASFVCLKEEYKNDEGAIQKLGKHFRGFYGKQELTKGFMRLTGITSKGELQLGLIGLKPLDGKDAFRTVAAKYFQKVHFVRLNRSNEEALEQLEEHFEGFYDRADFSKGFMKLVGIAYSGQLHLEFAGLIREDDDSAKKVFGTYIPTEEPRKPVDAKNFKAYVPEVKKVSSVSPVDLPDAPAMIPHPHHSAQPQLQA